MKNKRNLIRPLILLVLCGSCNKQLNLLPTDSFPPAKAFATVADLQKGLEGAYELNTGSSNAIYIGSLLADEVRPGSQINTSEGILSFTWQYTSNDALLFTEYLNDFAAYYSMIDAINKELASIDNVTPNNNSETLLKKRIKGELIALRGIAHFEVLIRFMGNGYNPDSPGVPIMLASDLLAQPARAKIKDVVAQVMTDLVTARADTAIPDAPDDVTRLNQAAIAAYQARVFLLTRQWDSVASYAGRALGLSGKTLTDRNNFAAYWLDANEVETLWKYRNPAIPQPQTYWNSMGVELYAPSHKLVNQFDPGGNDIRSGVYFTKNVSTPDTFMINKYPGNQTSPQVNDVKLVRVAELYLDLAEAYAHQPGNLSQAAAMLDSLWKARIKNYTPVTTFPDTTTAIQTVLTERLKELCFEGFRFFDLKRNALPVIRDPSDVQSFPQALTLQATDYHFALPIPEHEILANPNMKQNPGYQN